MHKVLLNAVGKWIKNVYKLRIRQLKRWGYSSTVIEKGIQYTPKHGYIPNSILNLFTQFHHVYTQQNTINSPLLYSQLYPISTAPIITKTKEK